MYLGVVAPSCIGPRVEESLGGAAVMLSNDSVVHETTEKMSQEKATQCVWNDSFLSGLCK